MNFFRAKKKSSEIESTSRQYTTPKKGEFDFRLKTGDEIYFPTAIIKKISNYTYEITFSHKKYLGVPQNNSKFYIKKISFTFNPNELYSLEEIQNKFSKDELRSNISGNPFVADNFFINRIGEIIRNGISEGKLNMNFNTFKLNNNYWVFNYKNRSFEEGKFYSFRTGKIDTVFTSNSSQKLPILRCFIESENIVKIGLCDTRNNNGIIPNNFSWDNYDEILNEFGSIKRVANNSLWYIISFSKQCRNLLNLREEFLPNKILFCVFPIKKKEISSDEMVKLNSTKEIEHSIVNTKVKLICANSIGKALAMVLHGTSLDGPKNENYKKLKIKNSFWLQLYKNQDEVAYLDLEHGMVRTEKKNNLKNIKLFVYGYRK